MGKTGVAAAASPSTPSRPVPKNHSPARRVPFVERAALPRPRSHVFFFRESDTQTGFLSNFYKHAKPLLVAGKQYATAEHLYQTLKFRYEGCNDASTDLADLVRRQNTPNKAKVLASGGGTRWTWQQQLKDAYDRHVEKGATMRPDWENKRLGAMRYVIRLKFAQDPMCAARLVATGDKDLVEDSPHDSFWGIGRDKKGKNVLGHLLMAERDRLRLLE